MKRLALIILLAFTAPVLAVDVAADQMADRGLAALNRGDKGLAGMTAALAQAGNEKAELGRQIGERDEWVKEAKAERDAAQSWANRVPVIVLHLIGALCAAAGAYCLLTRQFTEAVTLALIAGLNWSAGIAIARYAPQIALYGAIGGGLSLLAGVIFVVHSAWLNRHAAEEHANVIPIGEKTGILGKTQIDQLRAISFQETGRIGDWIRRKVTGKSQTKIAAEASHDIPPAPSVILPAGHAVVSGVVVPQ